MADGTRIEWADATFNPWIGCTKVSPACDHCYAERWGARFGVAWGNAPRRRTSLSTWLQPLKWNRAARRSGRPFRVFCASLADVFDNQVPIEWLADLLELVHDTESLTWLLLTKRPQNMLKRLREAAASLRERGHNTVADWVHGWLNGAPPPHVWLGTTTENQEETDRRVPELLVASAAKRFISAEPLLGPIDLRMLHFAGVTNIDALAGTHGIARPMRGTCARLDWVIVGGESGAPGARPMHPDWARSLRDQCQAAHTPYFFKQWGEHSYESRPGTAVYLPDLAPNQQALWGDGKTNHIIATRVGKKGAGRLLDGREWNEVPA